MELLSVGLAVGPEVHGEGWGLGHHWQLVSSGRCCHQRGVVHRDLKPSLTCTLNLRTRDSTHPPRTGRGGNPCYVAAEASWTNDVTSSRGHLEPRRLLYRTITRAAPEEGEGQRQLSQQVLGRGWGWNVPPYLTFELQNFLNKFIALTQLQGKKQFRRCHAGPVAKHGPGGGTQVLQWASDWGHGPRVTQEMVDLGFLLDRIQKALAKKTHSQVMATYPLLK